jgi:hypothetical protein
MKTMKAANRINLILIIFSITFISACNDDITNSTDNRDAYQIKAWDYSDNHYFLDTIINKAFLTIIIMILLIHIQTVFMLMT